MTIAEKSTELGIDLAQIALDANPILTCTKEDVFHSTTITRKCYR